jgi:hypothetical protein
VTDESLRVEDQPVPALREGGQRLQWEVGARESADDHPWRVPDGVLNPAVHVCGRPHVGELVDLHDPTVTLVVEREAHRVLRFLPDDREAETLEPGHDRVPVARRGAADEDDVEREVPDDRGRRHCRDPREPS